jgi:hypothetical protein
MWICRSPSRISRPPQAAAVIILGESVHRAIAMPADRRQFLTSAASGVLLFGGASPSTGTADPSVARSGEEDEVTPADVAHLQQVFGLDDLAKLTA